MLHFPTTYGILQSVALAAVVTLMLQLCGKRQIRPSSVALFGVVAVPVCWVCSRVVYCLASIMYYVADVENIPAMFFFWDGGYSMCGALIGLFLAALLTEKLTHTPHGRICDLLAIAAPLGICISRLAECTTTLGQGLPIDDWYPDFLAIHSEEWGSLYPVFAFEAIIALVILFGMLCSFRTPHGETSGAATLHFLLAFSCSQVVMESMRDDVHMEVHMGIHIQQIICAVVLGVIIIGLVIRCMKQRRINLTFAVMSLVMMAALIGLAIWSEFGVDRWESKLLAYAVMVSCMAGLQALGTLLNCKGLNANGKSKD